MTVKELIKILEKKSQDKEIWVAGQASPHHIQAVEETPEYVALSTSLASTWFKVVPGAEPR